MSADDWTPQSQCPKCGTYQDDLDGFGVLYCETCKFCQHPSRDFDPDKNGMVCGICGDVSPVDR